MKFKLDDIINKTEQVRVFVCLGGVIEPLRIEERLEYPNSKPRHYSSAGECRDAKMKNLTDSIKSYESMIKTSSTNDIFGFAHFIAKYANKQYIEYYEHEIEELQEKIKCVLSAPVVYLPETIELPRDVNIGDIVWEVIKIEPSEKD